jgi:3-hydroxyacyl-[acyl-carrier-protein] dehydratase
MTRNFAAPINAIDRIESMSETGIEAVKQIVADDPYLCGHYPDFTIYPGIFTIESVHQAVRKMVAAHLGEGVRTELASVVSVRLAAPLLPGDTLRVSCTRLSKPAKNIETADPDTFRVKAGCYRSDGVMAAQMTLELRLSHD